MSRTIKIFYKKLLSFFFLLIYTKPKILKDSDKDGDIKVLTLKKEKNLFRIYSIKNGRIYTNSVHDAAYLNKNNLLSGPSYQYRQSKNTNIRNNYVLKNGTPKLLKKFRGKILSILSGGAAKKNYAHWLFDTLSRLIIFNKFFVVLIKYGKF